MTRSTYLRAAGRVIDSKKGGRAGTHRGEREGGLQHREEPDVRSEGGERTRNKSRAGSVVEDSDSNNVNAAESTVMHGKNVGDIPTSGTGEKNGIVRMALFGQSACCTSYKRRRHKKHKKDNSRRGCIKLRWTEKEHVARSRDGRNEDNIKNKKKLRESRVYMVIGVIRWYCKNLSEGNEI